MLNGLLTEEGLAPLPLDEARPMIGRGARVLIERGFAADGGPLDDGDRRNGRANDALEGCPEATIGAHDRVGVAIRCGRAHQPLEFIQVSPRAKRPAASTQDDGSHLGRRLGELEGGIDPSDHFRAECVARRRIA